MTEISSPIKIITPSSDSAEEICNVIIQSITQVCAADYNSDPQIMTEWLANKTPEHVVQWITSKSNISFAAFNPKENKIVGFVLMNNSGEILLNYVLSSYLYKGIGKALLNKIEDVAKKLGLNELSAVSTITAKNFYEKNGFLKNGEPELVGHIIGDFPLIKRLKLA